MNKNVTINIRKKKDKAQIIIFSIFKTMFIKLEIARLRHRRYIVIKFASSLDCKE